MAHDLVLWWHDFASHTLLRRFAHDLLKSTMRSIIPPWCPFLLHKTSDIPRNDWMRHIHDSLTWEHSTRKTTRKGNLQRNRSGWLLLAQWFIANGLPRLVGGLGGSGSFLSTHKEQARAQKKTHQPTANSHFSYSCPTVLPSFLRNPSTYCANQIEPHTFIPHCFTF